MGIKIFGKFVLIFSTIIFALYGSIVLWYDNAWSIDTSTYLVQVIHDISNSTYHLDYSLTMENYVPWNTSYYIYTTYESHPNWGDLRDATQTDRKIHRFKLHERSEVIYYGEKIVSGPIGEVIHPRGKPIIYQVVDDSQTPEGPIKALPFTKLVFTMRISYDKLGYDPSIVGGRYVYGLFWIDAESRVSSGTVENIEHIIFDYPINILLPTILFILSGLGYAILKKEALAEIKNSFHSFNLIYKKKEASDQNLKQILHKLTHHLNLIDDGPAVFLTPTTTLLKMIVRRKATRYYHEGMLKSSKDSDILLNFIKNDMTKPSNTLLEFRVIALIVGLLASIGFSFNWNFEAIRPVLIAIGLLILFFNFGFSMFLLWKSPSDTLFIISLIQLTIASMMLEHYRWNLTTLTQEALSPFSIIFVISVAFTIIAMMFVHFGWNLTTLAQSHAHER